MQHSDSRNRSRIRGDGSFKFGTRSVLFHLASLFTATSCHLVPNLLSDYWLLTLAPSLTTDQPEEAEEVREGVPHHQGAAGAAGGPHRALRGERRSWQHFN